MQTKPTDRQMRVWATRAPHQNSAWFEQLTRCQYNPVACPLIEITELSDPGDTQAVKNLILSLDQFDKLIFVSQNAVKYGWSWIDQYWPQLPQGQSYYAVGSATAKALNHFLNKEGLHVIENDVHMNTEALLKVESLQELKGQGVLIFRGKGGRPDLGRQLEQRGAHIHYCELYHRQTSTEGLKTIMQAASTITSHDIFPVFSGEALKALATNFQQAGINLALPTVIVPGQRVQAIAHSLGFKRIHMTVNASETCMLNTIHSLMEPSA